jgi:hypothetical protein
MGGCIAAQSPPEPWQMIWRDLFVFAGLLFKSKAPQNLLRASVCGSKLRIRCCVLLYLDLTWARIGQRTSETTSLAPIWPKTGRRILRPDSKQVGDSPSPTCLRRLMRSLVSGPRDLPGVGCRLQIWRLQTVAALYRGPSSKLSALELRAAGLSTRPCVRRFSNCLIANWETVPLLGRCVDPKIKENV